MIRLLVLGMILSIFFFAACTPYNSSEANKGMLQGKWHLIDLKYTHPDSTKLNILQDTVYLSFRGDSIEERINNNLMRVYFFDVKKYDLYWFVNNNKVKTSIISLSEDTFKLKSPYYKRIYVKEK